MDSHRAAEDGWNYLCSSSWADIKDTFMASLPVSFPRMLLFLPSFFHIHVLSFPTAALFIWLHCFHGLILKPHFSFSFSYIFYGTCMFTVYVPTDINLNFIMIPMALTNKMKAQSKSYHCIFCVLNIHKQILWDEEKLTAHKMLFSVHLQAFD